MPDIGIHLNQANHNEAFFDSIDLNTYSDWAVTALFYGALQYIDAYLASVGYVDPGSHDVRDSLVRRYNPTRQVVREYFRLKNFSRTARYYAGRFGAEQVRQLRSREFQRIKARMTAEVGT